MPAGLPVLLHLKSMVFCRGREVGINYKLVRKEI
jgi:hypothetical protein